MYVDCLLHSHPFTLLPPTVQYRLFCTRPCYSHLPPAQAVLMTRAKTLCPPILTIHSFHRLHTFINIPTFLLHIFHLPEPLGL